MLHLKEQKSLRKDKIKIHIKITKMFTILTLSNVGIGTYLGNPDTETDKLVQMLLKNQF